MNNRTILAGLLLAAVSAVPAAASSRDKPFSLALTAGAEYDSHLSVEAIDLERGVGDTAAVFAAQAEYKPLQGRAGEVALGYDFDQSLYSEHDDFDTQSHRLTAGGALRLGKARLGADYGFHHVRLDGDHLLDMHTISPSISGFVADKLLARTYYSYFDKDFADFDSRNAEAHSAGIAVNRFFMDSRGYVSLGVRYDTENAVDPALDYDGYLLSANLQLPLGLRDGRGRVNFGYTYRNRDYDNLTPSIDERRAEKRSVFRARSEVPLAGKLGLELEYRYTDRSSNFPSADYNEHKALVALNYRF